MNNETLRKILTWLVFPVVIVVLVLLIVNSIMQPVRFNKEKAARESVAIQRMKDIRTLQVAYKGANNKFAADMDSLILFYKEGDMSIIMQVGSSDDSAAVAATDKAIKVIKSKARRISNAEINQKLYDMYKEGQTNLVFSVETKIPVRDTLFNNRDNFCVDSLAFIPFSLGEKIEMEAVVKPVSGVNVPLFEARIPYKKLLKGMDNQLRINLDAECRDRNRFEGLQVGSISAPNNNAGNWE